MHTLKYHGKPLFIRDWREFEQKGTEKRNVHLLGCYVYRKRRICGFYVEFTEAQSREIRKLDAYDKIVISDIKVTSPTGAVLRLAPVIYVVH